MNISLYMYCSLAIKNNQPIFMSIPVGCHPFRSSYSVSMADVLAGVSYRLCFVHSNCVFLLFFCLVHF